MTLHPPRVPDPSPVHPNSGSPPSCQSPMEPLPITVEPSLYLPSPQPGPKNSTTRQRCGGITAAEVKLILGKDPLSRKSLHLVVTSAPHNLLLITRMPECCKRLNLLRNVMLCSPDMGCLEPGEEAVAGEGKWRGG